MIENFYFFLYYSYSKAYLKFWGKRWGAYDVESKGKTYLITWIGLCLVPFVVLFKKCNIITSVNQVLALYISIIIPIIIYCVIQGSKKEKKSYYFNLFDNWYVLNKKRNRAIMIITLTFPWIILILYPFL